MAAFWIVALSSLKNSPIEGHAASILRAALRMEAASSSKTSVSF
jgi:hypothetical protein